MVIAKLRLNDESLLENWKIISAKITRVVNVEGMSREFLEVL